MARWRSSVALVCLLLVSAAAIGQQRRLEAYAGMNASPFRAQIGRRLTFLCAPTAAQTANVWGTDTYTDDSVICPAAIHAKVLPANKAGVVTIVMGSGAASFQGSTSNGVTSQGYGPWGFSYTFSQTGEPGQIDWDTAFLFMSIKYTDPIIVVCPSGGRIEARIWGTGVYTYDSSICVAGVHAGVISAAAGGKLTVTPFPPGLDAYAATTRNGVSSSSWLAGASRDYPYSFGVTLAPIVTNVPSAPGARSGVALKDTNLSRTIDLPAITAVGTSARVPPRTIDLPGITAAGTSTTVSPHTIDLPGITAVGTSTTVSPRTIDLPGITAVGASTTVPPRTIDLPGITGVGTSTTIAPRTIDLPGITAVGTTLAVPRRTVPRIAPEAIREPPPGGGL